MNLATVVFFMQLLGAFLAYFTLAMVLYGLWQGTRRQVGRVTGKMGNFMRSPWFYLITSLIYFGICYLCWIPLPPLIFSPLRPWMATLGALLYFPGMGFVLWGRLALGNHYFVSTGFGAQVFAGQRLVTGGPYAIVRHPMYTGLMLAALGSVLLYATWTTVLFAIFAPFITRRAQREEVVLSAEFGGEWREYCRRVPKFFPRLK